MQSYNNTLSNIKNDILSEFNTKYREKNKEASMENLILLSGTENISLANKISEKLSIKLSNCKISNFSNGEIKINIKENIRNRDICIISTCNYNLDTNKSINDCIIELLLMTDACKRSMAKSITVILPCYPYSRQDKKEESREPISAKLIANILESSGITRLVVMDLHASQIQGFFDIPVDNIYSLKLVINHLENTIFNNLNIYEKQSKFVVVSPDAGATKRTLKFAKLMQLNTVIMHKQRNYEIENTVEKTILIGDGDLLNNKIAIICDDICDTGGTLMKVIENLENYNINGVIIIVTHGIFSNNCLDKLHNSNKLVKIITSDSLSHNYDFNKYDKLEIFTISGLLANVIRNIISGESLSSLFL